ncbi:MAG: DUF4062 domain-containing protein [Acidimicrobiia bacterium]
MKVFISSVVGDFEQFRAAAAEAIEILGHRVLRSEDFPALARTPQQACLAAVRDADVVALLLGDRYGPVQESGLSATHEEYREARELKPVLVFVEEAVSPEPAQQEFIDEVQAWATGHLRRGFATPDDLRATLTRALHEHELALSSGLVDPSEMLERANAMVPRGSGRVGGPQLILAVVGGPLQQVLRPTDLEDPELARNAQREALFGDSAVLDASQGTEVSIDGTSLVLEQTDAVVKVDQTGSVLVGLPPHRATPRTAGELPALIEEDISSGLTRALRFAGWVLERIDSTHRITHVAVVAHLANAGYMPWRTRAEHQASPNAGQVAMGASDPSVTLTPTTRHRQALIHDADRIAEDLVALLRRTRN